MSDRAKPNPDEVATEAETHTDSLPNPPKSDTPREAMPSIALDDPRHPDFEGDTTLTGTPQSDTDEEAPQVEQVETRPGEEVGENTEREVKPARQTAKERREADEAAGADKKE